MPITDRLMATGSWSLDLVDNAPTAIRRALTTYGSQVYFTPSHIPDDGVTLAGLRASAFYGGIVTRRSNAKRSAGGPNLLGLVVSGEASSGYTATYPCTFAALLLSMCPGSYLYANGIGRGTAHSASTTNINASDSFLSFKALLDTAAAQSGNEYRLLPTGLIDYGVASSLFNSTPSVLVCPTASGREGNYRALEVTSWLASGDIDGWANGADITSADGTYTSLKYTNLSAPITFSTLSDPTNYSTLIKVFTANSNNHTDVDNQSQAAANQNAAEHITLRASVRTFCLHRFAVPGDWVDVYSLADDIVDRTNPTPLDGEVLYPKQMRLVGFTSPIEHGMGVKVVDGTYNGTQTITDITDYVKWETGYTDLELDSLPYRSNKSGDVSRIR